MRGAGAHCLCVLSLPAAFSLFVCTYGSGRRRSAYGAALLAMLVSCLLHLVATSYFLFVEILGANVTPPKRNQLCSDGAKMCVLFHVQDLFFSMLQFLWLFFHVTRLLLIIEPCHTASVEVSMCIRAPVYKCDGEGEQTRRDQGAPGAT